MRSPIDKTRSRTRTVLAAACGTGLLAAATVAHGDGFELASITNAYAQKPRLEDGQTTGYDSYWALQAKTAIPSTGLQATGEYSVTSYSTDDASGQGDHLLRLGLEGGLASVRYGARYFSVGEGFTDNPVGAEHLASRGLAAASRGHEFWANWRAGKLTVRPQAKWMTTAAPDGKTTRHSQTSVAINHPLGAGAALSCNFSNATVQPENNATQTSTETKVIRYSAPKLNFELRSTALETEHLGQARQGDASGQVSFTGTIRLAQDLSISPSLVRREAYRANELWEVVEHAGVRLNLVDKRDRSVTYALHLQHDARQAPLEAEESSAFRLALDAAKSAKILGGRTSLGAQVSYGRQQDQLGRSQNDFAFNLKFSYIPGA